MLETGLELGMNLVDTADVYGLGWGGKAFGEATVSTTSCCPRGTRSA